MMMRENEKSLRALAMLRYQADRYQSAGNGAMSQRLNINVVPGLSSAALMPGM